MNEGRPSSSAAPERQFRSWLERLGQALQGEPKDRDELIAVLEEAQNRNLLDIEALTMIKGVMEVSELQTRDIMIPRSQMVVLERDISLEALLPIVIESAHSRFPVIGENRDEVLGIVLAKDLLPFVARGDGTNFNIRELLRPAFVIPESKRLNTLLKEFRTSRNHMAIVVDEYGGVAGLVTIEDVIEQIVGEIEDEHDFDEDDAEVVTVAEGRWNVRALTSIEDFNDHFHSQFSDEEFDTIGGLVLAGFGRMPKRGESLTMGGFQFKVSRADNRRIYLLEVSQAEEASEARAGQA